MVELTEKSMSVFKYVKDNGGKVSVDEIAAALGTTVKSVRPTITLTLKKKGLVEYVKEMVGDTEIGYAVLTELGNSEEVVVKG